MKIALFQSTFLDFPCIYIFFEKMILDEKVNLCNFLKIRTK